MAGPTAADTAKTAAGGYFNPGGYIVSTAIRVIGGKDRTKGPKPREREQLLAAGYTVSRMQTARGLGYNVWTDPAGRVIGPDAARVVAKRLPVPLPTPPIAPQPQLPTGSDIFEELLRRPSDRIGRGPLPRTEQQGRDLFEELLKRPRAPAPEPSAPVKAGRVLGRVLGRVGGIIGGILYPSDTADSDLYPPGTAIPLPAPDRPTGPPRRPVISRRPRDLPKQPGPSGGSIPDRTGPQPAPLPGSPYPLPTVLLPLPGARPQVTRRPLTTVRPPMASPWDLLTMTIPSPRSDPFRSPVVSVQPNPILSIANRPGAERDILRNPLLSAGPLTLTQSSPVGSPPSDRCSCPPKRKRKPTEPRKVCYTGSYREKSRGLSKTPRRKIPCL